MMSCWLFVVESAGPKCYSCAKVSNVQDCNNVVQCGDREKCFSRRFLDSDSHEYYTLGCDDSNACGPKTFSILILTSGVGKRGVGFDFDGNLTQSLVEHKAARIEEGHALRRASGYELCYQCCDGDYCNRNLCDSQIIPTALRCFDCNPVSSPYDCDYLTECDPRFSCYIHRGPSHATNRLEYDMGCMSDIQCRGAAIAFNNLGCFHCCNENYCNLYACKNSTAQTTRRTTHAPTTTTTTAEIPLSLVPGPVAQAQYLSHISAKCSSMPGITIGWGFKDTNNLPVGARTDGYGTLTIDKLTPNNAGVYKCVAVSPTGHLATRVIEVKIVEVPATALYIERQPSGLIASGARFSLRCHVIGYPVPTVTWSFADRHGGHTIPSSIRYSDHGQVLIVDHYNHLHNDGDWSCTAKNNHGSSTTHLTMP